MLIKPQNNETDYIHFVYRNLTGLGIVLHTVYAVMMGMLQFAIPCFYNICSVLFYIGMLLLVTKRKKYAAAVSLIHLETICFVSTHTILFGWNSAFFLFLVGMASLVYFCPYRKTYIPYVFSLLHILAFFLLHLNVQDPILPADGAVLLNILFICNSIGAFVIILYVAYVSRASAIIGKEALIKQNEDLLQIADYDQLTGLYNRSCMKKRISQCDSSHSFLAMGDIDDFKLINDTYGHICGDHILRELAELMRSKLDPNIFICRWGGEEFIFHFHNASDEEAIQQLTEFCQWLKSYTFMYEHHSICVTMTFGICQGRPGLSLDHWINQADQLLYQGKRNGKQMVVFHTAI